MFLGQVNDSQGELLASVCWGLTQVFACTVSPGVFGHPPAPAGFWRKDLWSSSVSYKVSIEPVMTAPPSPPPILSCAVSGHGSGQRSPRFQSCNTVQSSKEWGGRAEGTGLQLPVLGACAFPMDVIITSLRKYTNLVAFVFVFFLSEAISRNFIYTECSRTLPIHKTRWLMFW